MTDEIKSLEIEASAIRGGFKKIEVIDNQGYEATCEYRKTVKAYEKRVHEYADADISSADKLHGSLIAKRNELLSPVELVLPKIDQALRDYDNEQDRLRKAEEVRLQALARKQEEDRRLADAALLEAQGDKKEADAVLAEPVHVPPVVLAKTTPKVQGISYKEIWKYKIVDASRIPPAYLKPDEVRIGQVVRALKGSCNIPGVKAYPDKTVAGRAG